MRTVQEYRYVSNYQGILLNLKMNLKYPLRMRALKDSDVGQGWKKPRFFGFF